MSNVDDARKKDYIRRWVAVEQAFAEAKSEHDELLKDLKTEIKTHSDETGVEAKEVGRLAKIMLDVPAATTKLEEATEDMANYELLYGEVTADDDDI